MFQGVGNEGFQDAPEEDNRSFHGLPARLNETIEGAGPGPVTELVTDYVSPSPKPPSLLR